MPSSCDPIQLGRPGAKARKAPTPARRGWIVPAVFTALLATNAATLVALTMAPDIRYLLASDDREAVTAYERRITELRLEVDRLHSRQYARAGDLNLQLHELVQQQEVLSGQHEYVRALAERARELGIEPQIDSPIGTDPLITGSFRAIEGSGGAEVARLADRLAAMQDETRLALSALSDAAQLSTGTIVAELDAIGLAPRFSDAPAMGGPLLPAGETLSELSLIDEANAVALALDQFRIARDALGRAPVAQPVKGRVAVSSGFGNRRDPFLKRAAFHSGIDFPVPTGTSVVSAGAGTVTFAGSNGGYGNMVDIDHGNGLVTRYAHLSRVTVARGQAVSANAEIGKAGSTGRSTGPHLHFEVRRGDRPLDPAAFLAAGRKLAQFF